MGKTMNLGKVAMTTAGDYDSSKSYERLTLVTHNHASWVSRKDVPVGVAPGTNDVYWQKISERGEQGIQGPVGPQGNSAFDGNGVEIVNNLTQGGEAAVLSAEQGKVLGKSVNNIDSVLAIEEQNTDITSQFTGFTYSFTETTVGNVSIPTGAYQGFRGGKFPVKAGERYEITGLGGAAYRLYCLVDNGDVILKISAPDVLLDKFIITVEKDGYLYVSCLPSYDFSLIKSGAASLTINNIHDNINNINEKIDDYDEHKDKVVANQEKITELASSISSIGAAIGYREETEDLSSQILNGFWKVTSDGQEASVAIHGVGASGIATKKWDGSWKSLELPVKAGEVFRISGASGVDGRLFLVLDSDGTIIQEAEAHLAGTENLMIEKDGTLYCSFVPAISSYSVYKLEGEAAAIKTMNEQVEEVKRNTVDLSTRTMSIEKYLGYEEVEQDLGEFMLNGYWQMSSYEVGTKAIPEKVWDGGWMSIEYSVKAGEKYRITGLGGVSGRIYILLDSSGYIQAVSSASASLKDFILSIEKDGTLYCSFAKDSAFSLVKLARVFTNNIGGGVDYTKGSFEFGKTCNLDYTCPEIGVWPWPETGQRVNTINGYYEELMAEFPQYITRVSCDEAMASLGVSKPSAIQNAPMYMYRFLPPRTPEGSQVTTSVVNRIKVFVVTGTHPEFTAVWDMINAMRLVCRSWRDDKNLDELRWNADIYVIPCLNQYGLDYGQRTNENGVDINRNAPTSDWVYQGVGTQTFSGTEPASEYSTKVLVHFLNEIKPDVFIDHHATNVGSGDDEGDGKNMIYVHSTDKLAIDVGGVLISQMTRKWRDRYADTFPSVEEDPVTIFGFSTEDTVPGSLSKYASENGSFGSTYESNFGILYKNKEYGTQNRQTNTVLVNTCATEGWINYLVRLLRAYSEMVGIK